MAHRDIVSGQDGFRAEEHDETAPLLPDGSTHRNATEFNDNSSTATARTYFKTTAGIIMLLIAIVPATSAMMPSLQRLIELTTCRAYYLKHDPSMVASNGWVEEKYCKIDEVQKQFAYITGWSSLFEAIPGIIMSVPVGTLADSKGRKLVFAIAVIAIYLQLLWVGAVSYFYKTFPDPRALWFNAIFLLLSGGSGMLTAMILTMLADITSSRDL
jgi:MFS family permease